MFLRFSWSHFWKQLAILLVQFWVPFGLAMTLSTPSPEFERDRWIFMLVVILIHTVIVMVAFLKGKGGHSAHLDIP